MTTEQFADLVQEIRARRVYGEVIAHREPYDQSLSATADLIQAIDRFVASRGLSSLGHQWTELTRDGAADIVEAMLWRDLAYHSETMSRAEAADFAARLLVPFPAATRFFTNHPDLVAWMAGRKTSVSRSGITAHTFDAAVVAAGGGWLQLFCVADED